MLTSRGFTLIELMLVVGIIGILAGIAIGFSGNFVRRARFNAETRDVFSALTLARAEAVQKGTTVKISFAAPLIQVFRDTNDNLQYDADEPLSVSYTVEPDMSVTSTILTDANGRPTAIFDYRGFSLDIAAKPLAIVVCIKDSRLRDVNAVEVTIAGAARIRNTDAFEVCPVAW